jgi:ubiquitin C-terminal hydrolase
MLVNNTIMDLKKYNPKLAILPNGLKNTGVLCYFNALIQSLLSCTSFIEAILEIDQADQSNELLKVLFFICSQITQDKWSPKYSIAIWSTFIREIKNQQKTITFGNGQEDTHEALLLFLDCLDFKNNTGISKLFQHRYRCYITCPECDQRHQAEANTGSIRMISYVDEKDLTNGKLTDFLRSHVTHTDENHKCDRCSFRGIKQMQYNLTMLPEIFIILFKKYEKKWISNRPKNLKFVTSNSNNIMSYKLVSQVEHSGSHYWSRSLRKTGISILNDINVSSCANWDSDELNTYLVFYHYTGLV